MVVSCCAYGCKEKWVKGGLVTFHSFPKDDEKRKAWEVRVRRENFKPTNHSRLCSKHFAEDCFNRSKFGGTWLKTDALPTIFDFRSHLPKTIKEGFPLKGKAKRLEKSTSPPPQAEPIIKQEIIETEEVETEPLSEIITGDIKDANTLNDGHLNGTNEPISNNGHLTRKSNFFTIQKARSLIKIRKDMAKKRKFDILADFERRRLSLLKEELEMDRKFLKLQEKKTQIMEQQLAVSKQQLALFEQHLHSKDNQGSQELSALPVLLTFLKHY